MKNLYEQLKPEIQDSIQEDLEKYPTTTKDLINSLKSVNFWSELKVHDVSRIITHSHYSFMTLSHQDIIWGDKFLINEKKQKTSNS